jgi:hypothetical protein
MSNTNNGGPAFPGVDEEGDAYNGMTLRDYFAAKAMQGWIASFAPTTPVECAIENSISTARMAYAIADAMLKVRGDA